MANSSFFKNDGVTTSLQTNLTDKAADAEKLAINPEDDQFTLSDGTTTGYSALHHKEKALDAQTASEAARDASQAARDLSQTYRNTAEDHKDDAETAKVAAEAAKVAAETAETNAETAETNAQASEDEAEAWASKTDGEAVTGEGYSAKAHAVGGTGVTNSTGAAKEWATKAEDSTVDGSEYSAKHYSAKASASATTASTKASEASTSAAAAAASQTAAAASAASAASTYDQFDDRYLGTKSSDPSTDNDGNALVEGALYFSSTDNAMQVYDGSEWIAASSAGSVSITETYFTATAGQTTFNVSYTVDNLVVIMNGVVLQNGASKDYTATNGTSFTLATGASAGDELHVIVFKSFTTADMVSKTNGGAYSGSVDFTGGLEINGTAVTATAAELNLLDGVTATTAELNYVDGATSNIQTQIDNISTDVVSDTTPQLGGNLDLNSSDITGTGNIDITGSADFSSSATIGTDVILGSTSQGLIFGNTNGVNIRSASGKDTIFDNAGSERMRLTSDGKLGIGDTPDKTLHVSKANSEFRIDNAGAEEYTVSTGAVDGAIFHTYYDRAGSTYTDSISRATTHQWRKGDGVEAVRINSSGNVGIGTSSPARPIHINNASPNIRLQDSDGSAGAYVDIGADTSGSCYLLADHGNNAASSKIRFYIDGSEKASLNANATWGKAPLHTPLKIQQFNPSGAGTQYNTTSSSYANTISFNYAPQSSNSTIIMLASINFWADVDNDGHGNVSGQLRCQTTQGGTTTTRFEGEANKLNQGGQSRYQTVAVQAGFNNTSTSTITFRFAHRRTAGSRTVVTGGAVGNNITIIEVQK